MNKIKINVWEREFELNVVYDCLDGEDVLPTQNDALIKFLSAAPRLIDDAKQSVEEYCIKHDAEDIGSTPIVNIFKYVIPKSIYIQRTTDGSRIVGLMCAYKFDIDNGIAIVFKNETLERVGTQNIIL